MAFANTVRNDSESNSLTVAQYEESLKTYEESDAIQAGVSPDYTADAVCDAKEFYEEFKNYSTEKKEAIVAKVNKMRNGDFSEIEWEMAKMEKDLIQEINDTLSAEDVNTRAAATYKNGSITKTTYLTAFLIETYIKLNYSVKTVNGKKTVSKINSSTAIVVRNLAIGNTFTFSDKEEFIKDNQACVRTYWAVGIGIGSVNAQWGTYGITLGGNTSFKQSYYNEFGKF